MARVKNHEKQFSGIRIEEDKITKYLLNPNHGYGKAKANFFGSIGFSPDSPKKLSAVLSEHYKTAKLEKKETSEWGTKYIFVCEIQPPKGQAVCVVSVWQMDKGKKTLRFITAYPR